MECIILGCRLKTVDGNIYKLRIYKSEEEKWVMLKGTTDTHGYIKIKISYKFYFKHRLLHKLANPEWNLDDSRKNNSIDHINIDCRDNSLENLRPATALQQVLNRKCVINAKGYSWDKRAQKWYAQIVVDRVHKFLGYFVLEADARQAYLNAVAKYRT